MLAVFGARPSRWPNVEFVEQVLWSPAVALAWLRAELRNPITLGVDVAPQALAPESII
jgi:hypothetical protein